MAHCECILDTQSCNECPSYVDAESSKVVKGQFHWEKILTCYFCTKKHILLLCYFHLGSFSLMDRTVEENHVSWITTTVPPMQVCVTLFFQAAKMHVMRVLGVSDSDLSLGVFFCDSLDPCYDPCHVIKHESLHSIFSLKHSYVMIHVYT